MRPRHNGAPEVAPSDIEGGSKTVSMAGAGGRPVIQPFEGIGSDTQKKSRRRGGAAASLGVDNDTMRTVGMVVGGLWLAGWLFMGWELMWPLYFVLDVVYYILSFPPFSWIFGFLRRGAPMLTPTTPADELTLPNGQVPHYADTYVNQYGDAALIFATHDGYPQIVKTLLMQEDLGYQELIDARDDSGNTALIYAAAKGFRQCTAALIRSGADPDVPNEGNGGRTALMEAAGAGFRDIVNAIRLTPNITIDQQDEFGNTALHYAAYHGNLAVVMELMKSEPDKEVQNIYGHTPASYALTNKHKAVADALNRQGPTRSQRMAQEQKDQEEDYTKKLEKEMQEMMQKAEKARKKQEKHVHGSAEDLHKKDADFAPALERASHAVTDSERKALEDQIAKLRREHDEAELKSQKRIVELLEKSSDQQRAIDKALADHRAAQLNTTDLQFKVSELESKHRASELRAQDEASRASRLQDEHQQAKFEAERHQSRAEAAERERDHHVEMGKRHQENAQRMQDEVGKHLTRIEQQQQEMETLRQQLQRAEEEKRKHQAMLDQLKSGARSSSPTAASAPSDTASAASASAVRSESGASAASGEAAPVPAAAAADASGSGVGGSADAASPPKEAPEPQGSGDGQPPREG